MQILMKVSQQKGMKFGNVLVISSHTLLAMWLLIQNGIKDNPC